MKAIAKFSIVTVAMLMSELASAQVITGDVTGGGEFDGTVTSSNAWITSSTLDGEAVNFWTFTANAGDTLSVTITSSAIEFGVSVYQGLVEQMELLIPGFDNQGDFGDNTYIAGTNPMTGAVGTYLVDITLPTSGIYTLAIGGEQGFSYDGVFAYDLDVDIAPVPLPAAGWLLLSGLLGLIPLRRR